MAGLTREQRKVKMEKIEQAKAQEIVETKRQAEKKAKRKERIPLGNARLKLTAPVKEGKKRRWINDVGGRLDMAQQGGYEFVTDSNLQIGEAGTDGNQDLGTRISRVVGTREDGQPMQAYLMEIDEDLYNEDQAAKARKLDEVDNEIRRGNIKREKNDARYIPKEGITYKP